MKWKEIMINPYDIPLRLIDTDSVTLLKEKFYFPQNVIDKMGGEVFAYTILGRNGRDQTCLYLALNTKYEDPITRGLVAHEAYHVCDYVFELISEYNHYNTESKAYLIGWLVDEIHKFLEQ